MSRFHSIGISDPRFERDGLRHITVKSPSLKGRGDITVFVPSGAENGRELPIAILLHGIFGSHLDWSMRGGAHQTANRLIETGEIAPLLLAMPSDGLWGDGSGYLAHDDKDFENWIVEDVPAAVRETVDQAGEASPLCIGGLSMGGFGAMILGARHAGKFRAISAHSSVTVLDQIGRRVQEDPTRFGIADHDKCVLQTLVAHREQLPPLRLDCGDQDILRPANRKLTKELAKAGIPHSYEEFPGDHDWPYWEAHIEDSLRFFDERLRR
jgi:putative tributyrin esterase